MTLSLQLYSLREFMNLEQSLEFCKAKGLCYVEPAGLYDLKPREMVAVLKKHGLQARSFHFGLEFLQGNWRELATVLPECGTRDLVMPFAVADGLAEVKQLAADLQDLAEKLKALGLRLHYHNHAHEISRNFGGKCCMDYLLELAPDLYWQLDVGWVTAAGAAVPPKLRQWRDRIAMLHIKDILQKDGAAAVATQMVNGVEVVVSAAAQKGGQPACMGAGIVDFAGIFACARQLGISTFVLENDNPEDVDAFADSGIALVERYAGQIT